jgi:hypothetical protein
MDKLVKRNLLIAFAFALICSACSHSGSENDAAMLNAVNKSLAAHPICTTDMVVTKAGNQWMLRSFGGDPAWYPDRAADASGVPKWTLALEKAGLLIRESRAGRFRADPGSHMLALAPQIKPTGTSLCIGHAVADSVAKAEPLNEAAAQANGLSKDALSVEFRSHFAYVNWAANLDVQNIIWNDMLNVNTKNALVPSYSAVLYNDPVRGWKLAGTNP